MGSWQCPARVGFGQSRSEKWRKNVIHSFREVQVKKNDLRSRSRNESEMKMTENRDREMKVKWKSFEIEIEKWNFSRIFENFKRTDFDLSERVHLEVISFLYVICWCEQYSYIEKLKTLLKYTGMLLSCCMMLHCTVSTHGFSCLSCIDTKYSDPKWLAWHWCWAEWKFERAAFQTFNGTLGCDKLRYGYYPLGNMGKRNLNLELFVVVSWTVGYLHSLFLT